jgi:hypothetical protein
MFSIFSYKQITSIFLKTTPYLLEKQKVKKSQFPINTCNYQNTFYIFAPSSRYLERDANRVEHHGGKTMRAFRPK